MITPKKKHAKNLGISFKRYMLIYTRGYIEANEAIAELCLYRNKLEREDLARIRKELRNE